MNVAVLVAISFIGIAACRAMRGVWQYTVSRVMQVKHRISYLEQCAYAYGCHQGEEHLLDPTSPEVVRVVWLWNTKLTLKS